MLKLVIQISKGLVRDARMRRMLMFYSVLIALALLFGGATIFDGWLRDRPMLFIIYWAACAWITLLSVLLAFFDMLVVRAAARRERRQIEAEYLRKTADRHDQDAR